MALLEAGHSYCVIPCGRETAAFLCDWAAKFLCLHSVALIHRVEEAARPSL